MFKRVMAWIILAGFVLLMLNLVFGFFYRELSIIIYIIVVVAFLLSNKGIKPR